MQSIQELMRNVQTNMLLSDPSHEKRDSLSRMYVSIDGDNNAKLLGLSAEQISARRKWVRDNVSRGIWFRHSDGTRYSDDEMAATFELHKTCCAGAVMYNRHFETGEIDGCLS